MDISIKLPKKGMLLINSLKNDFIKDYIKSRKLKYDNTKKMTDKFLSGKKIKLKKGWLKEIDTTI